MNSRRAGPTVGASQVEDGGMTLPVMNVQTPAHQNNVRLVLVDDQQQPAYLKRATQLEQDLLAAAAKLGVEHEDMPGLRGMCVEAVRAAESHHH